MTETIDRAEAEQLALEVKEEVTKQAQDDIMTLASGHRVRFVPVPHNTLREARAKIVDPPIPMIPHPEDKTRQIENPMSVTYRETILHNEEERLKVVLDVLFLFGLELLDPLPADNKWQEKLILLGLINADEVEGASALQQELWYKKWVISDSTVFEQLYGTLGVSKEAIAQARAAFKSNTQRAPDREPRPPETD